MDLKNFTKKMKKESNQIPILAKGVVAMELNSPLLLHMLNNYYEEVCRTIFLQSLFGMKNFIVLCIELHQSMMNF
jgi:hypothetical protein